MKAKELNRIFEDLRNGHSVDKFRLAQLHQYCLQEKNFISYSKEFKHFIKENKSEMAKLLKKPVVILLDNLEDETFSILEIEKIINYLIDKNG